MRKGWQNTVSYNDDLRLASAQLMADQQSGQFSQCQRINVEREVKDGEKVIKVVVERHDESLGCYTAGALTLPLHQLPLLQQALQDVCVTPCQDCSDSECPRKIIPFPTIMSAASAALPG